MISASTLSRWPGEESLMVKYWVLLISGENKPNSAFVNVLGSEGVSKMDITVSEINIYRCYGFIRIIIQYVTVVSKLE